MTAAQQLWTDNSRHYGAKPLRMSALADNDDSTRPIHRTAMPDDQNESRSAETLAPPTDRETPTSIEHDVPERRDALPPPPAPSISPKQADSMFSAAVKDIAEAARTIREEREARRTFEETQLDLQRQTISAIERAERNGEANWKSTQHQIETWRKVDDAKNAEQDDRLSAVEKAIGDLKAEVLAALPEAMAAVLAPYIARIEALEREAAELRANAPRTPQAPATTA